MSLRLIATHTTSFSASSQGQIQRQQHTIIYSVAVMWQMMKDVLRIALAAR